MALLRLLGRVPRCGRLCLSTVVNQPTRPKYEHDSPLRDYVNYPAEIIRTKPGKVRFGFIPDEWFQFFYPKTGVTGPYVFGINLSAFLLSKEYFVWWFDVNQHILMIITCCLLVKFLRQPVRDYLESERDQREGKLQQMFRANGDLVQKKLHAIERLEKLPEVVTAIGQARRDCITLQQELEYRRRIHWWSDAIQRRLDYTLAVAEAKQRLQREQLVDWVVNEAKKAFDDRQQKAYMMNCINKIKTLKATVQI